MLFCGITPANNTCQGKGVHLYIANNYYKLAKAKFTIIGLQVPKGIYEAFDLIAAIYGTFIIIKK